MNVDTPSERAGTNTAPPSPSGQSPRGTDLILAEVRAEHEAVIARLKQDHERRLTEQRRVAEEQIKAARVDAQRQLDAMEQALLQSVDRALARQEQHLRRQVEERIARLREEQREAILVATRCAEQAAEATSPAAAEVQRIRVYGRDGGASNLPGVWWGLSGASWRHTRMRRGREARRPVLSAHFR